MVAPVEAVFFEFFVVGDGFGSEGVEVVDEVLFAGLVALVFEGLGVSRIFDVLVAPVVPGMGGDELFLAVVEEDLFGVGA